MTRDKKWQFPFSSYSLFRYIVLLSWCVHLLEWIPYPPRRVFGMEVFQLENFIMSLSVKVAEVSCMASPRSRNGGILSIAEVQSVLMKRGTKTCFSYWQMKGSKYSKDDIVTATGKLSKLVGSGFRTVQIGNSMMVISCPYRTWQWSHGSDQNCQGYCRRRGDIMVQGITTKSCRRSDDGWCRTSNRMGLWKVLVYSCQKEWDG